MYCADTKTVGERQVTTSEAPCFPEQVYNANCGLKTGLSTIGFRSGRYTPLESLESFNRRIDQSALDEYIGDKTRDDNKDLIRKTQTQTEANFKESTIRLKERLTDIHFWKYELEREILDIIDKTDKLLQRKIECEKALLALDEAILLCTDSLNARQRRFGEDLQQDNVELELIKELDILNKSVALYKKTIEQLNNQIKRNRDVKQDMEMVWSDKQEADQLLATAHHLLPTDTNKQTYPGEARSYPMVAQSTVESWTQHAHNITVRGEHERMASEQLLQVSANIIRDVERDVLQQKDVVNTSLQKRLDQYELEKAKFMEHLKKVCNEIRNMENSIHDLQLAIADKDAYIKTVQTRLHLSNQRRNVENCRDPSQKALLDEYADLERSLDDLRDQLARSENNLIHLQDTQLMLEKQINMKTNSIQVDKDHCARHRMAFPDANRLSGN